MFDRRLMVLLLLWANLIFWAWSSGWFSSLGWAPATDSEPQRLDQQVTPYKLQLQKDKGTSETPAPGPSKP
jgi:hypothetical protein